jgi:hypothetical protein
MHIYAERCFDINAAYSVTEAAKSVCLAAS